MAAVGRILSSKEKQMIYNDCDSYISHLRAEHSRLERCAEEVYTCLRRTSNPWAADDRREVATRLRVMQRELWRHIEIEVEGGCVEEAVTRTPWLSQDARDVFRENEQLQDELLTVLDLVDLGESERARRAFTQFANDLSMHDRHEAWLVEQGLRQVCGEDGE